MGNKNKTISFRVNEDAFETLREIAEERDLSLSQVFRDYVDMLVAHDGQVEVVPKHELNNGTESPEGPPTEFPPKIEVPKRFVREHERLELEAEHLRDQLDEYKQYVSHLKQQMPDDADDIVLLDDLDDREKQEDEPQFRLG
ncbi:CopG family transcriptional regulator [Halobacteriales archaeon SW_7_68_16]|nr:MAG: CopG family transcriptional regulator [Halobacteriales archaeon SW_7_68_16]